MYEMLLIRYQHSLIVSNEHSKHPERTKHLTFFLLSDQFLEVIRHLLLGMLFNLWTTKSFQFHEN